MAEGRNEEQVETDTIFYSVWADGAWSQPVDILTDNDLASANSIVITQDDRLLVTWRNRNSLFLSQADLDQAGSAMNWQTQDMGLGSVALSDLFVDDQNRIHMIYAAHAPALGQGALGYMVSLDGGDTWSQPEEILSFDGSKELLTNVQIYADDTGRLHVVWNRNSAEENWLPVGVYYAMSDSSGQTWTAPEEVFVGARAAYPFISPSAQSGRLYMNWLRGVGYEDSKYIRSSDNDGETWTSPQLVFQNLQGLNGAMPIVVDSSDTEYWIMSGDAPDGSTQIHYSRQSNGDGWSTPISVSPELRDSEFPDATILNGNQLHIVWNEFVSDDIYHVVCQLDGPEILPLPMPTAVADMTTPESSSKTELSADQVALTTATTPTRDTTLPESLRQPVASSTQSPIQMVILAVLPAFLIVAGVVFWQTTRSRRN
ncbi:MAG: exo-alpha-sialidase [Anaerolineae bacterium]|nr:exo-alpha-sialidase [Anaerolineae bacterium]